MTIVSHLTGPDRDFLAHLLVEGRTFGGLDMASYCDRLARQLNVVDEYRAAARKMEAPKQRGPRRKAGR